MHYETLLVYVRYPALLVVAISTVIFHTAAARPVILSVNSRPPLVSGHSLHVLEHSAR